MTRSRQTITGQRGHDTAARKGGRHALRYAPLASAISAILAGVPAAHAQQPAAAGALEEVVVTAQKKSENLQDVPVSIQALGTEKLEELHIANLDDYVKYLPGVTTVKGLGQGGNGIGTTHVYMRGVVSGGDGNHSGPLPSVGTYLDEQPVTTVDGTVDIHVYDIERVEVLEGPQGTLYGASSEAGTIRIITNKPDPAKFAAGYNVGVNSVAHGGIGYVGEGFVNLPLSPVAAVRLVGWDQHDAGYIDNVAGTNAAVGIVNGIRTFNTWSGQTVSLNLPTGSSPFTGAPFVTPSPGVVGAGAISNAAYVKKHYNDADTRGGRAALKLNLGDNWTVTPTIMGQAIDANGFFGYDPAVGDLKVVHFGREHSRDSFTQSALTVEGKISDFDIVYAGAYMVRNQSLIADYSDYSFFYDKIYGSGTYWRDNAGNPIDGQQVVVTRGHYVKWSDELRVNTPQSQPVKATAGVFVQRQLHDIWEQYLMPGYGTGHGLADSLSIPNLPTTIWLTNEQRVDRDSAVFGQVTWDIAPDWSVTGGVRYYKAKNSIEGFYGYSAAYQANTGYSSGMTACALIGGQNRPFQGAPCTSLYQSLSESGHTQRVNVTHKFDADRMVYATYSTGFRPGGINRVYDSAINATFPPYAADFLNNYELGWKTRWFEHHLKFNGALFFEKWDNFQFVYLGPNSVSVVQNAASAEIKGVEAELEWAVGNGLTLSASATYVNAKTTTNYCGYLATIPGTATLSTVCPGQVNEYNRFVVGPPGPEAPSGTQLPVAPKFKGNLVARYTFGLADWEANVQGALVYQTSTIPLLRLVDQINLGTLPAYGLFDLSGGIEKNGMSFQLVMTNVLDKRANLTRFEQCTTTTCIQPYIIPAQPRTVALKFGQKF